MEVGTEARVTAKGKTEAINDDAPRPSLETLATCERVLGLACERSSFAR
jgi:hypothetical protein